MSESVTVIKVIDNYHRKEYCGYSFEGEKVKAEIVKNLKSELFLSVKKATTSAGSNGRPETFVSEERYPLKVEPEKVTQENWEDYAGFESRIQVEGKWFSGHIPDTWEAERTEIKTKRLLLKPHGIKYLQSTHEYASDLETTKYMMWLPNDTIEETAEFLRKSDAEWAKEIPSYYEFSIIFEGKHVGAVSIYLNEARTEAEFGWILHKDFWHRGIATEAAKALIEFGVNELGVHHFTAHCDSENTGSFKVMEKLGMQRMSCSSGRKNKSSDEERKEYLYELSIKKD